MRSCGTCGFSYATTAIGSPAPESAASVVLTCPRAPKEEQQQLGVVGAEVSILVLLYYSYVAIDDVPAAVEWHKMLCEHLDLKGRLRITPEGVNVVLDGMDSNVREYCGAVRADGRWGSDIEFKLGGLNKEKPAESQRFRSLAVQQKGEVVSLGLPPGAARPQSTARHVSPLEWHEALEKAQQSTDGGRVVLLDTRNSYESRIGRFECAGGGVETIVPDMRQFTDFPSYVDANIEKLRGKKVMMYCTGGVRCERASALVKERLAKEAGEGGGEGGEWAGPETEVMQLSGGVHAYLRDIGGNGFFAGKNFVFDPRRTEPVYNETIIGRCHACAEPHDDYDNGPECRCVHCRCLLLLCDACRSSRDWPLSPTSGCIEQLPCSSATCTAAVTNGA